MARTAVEAFRRSAEQTRVFCSTSLGKVAYIVHIYADMSQCSLISTGDEVASGTSQVT
jgi:hypothetical protein